MIKVYNLSNSGCEKLYNYIRQYYVTEADAAQQYLPDLCKYNGLVVVSVAKLDQKTHDYYILSELFYRILNEIKPDLELHLALGSFGSRYNSKWENGIQLKTNKPDEILMMHLCKKINTRLFNYNQSFQTSVFNHLVYKSKYKSLWSSTFSKTNNIIAHDCCRIKWLSDPVLGTFLYGVNAEQFHDIFEMINKPENTLSFVQQILIPQTSSNTKGKVILKCINEEESIVEYHQVNRKEYIIYSFFNPSVYPGRLFNIDEITYSSSFNTVFHYVTDEPIWMQLHERVDALVTDSSIFQKIEFTVQDTFIDYMLKDDNYFAAYISFWINDECSLNDILNLQLIPSDKVATIVNLMPNDEKFDIEPFHLVTFQSGNNSNKHFLTLNNSSYRLIKFLERPHLYTCASGTKEVIEQYKLENNISCSQIVFDCLDGDYKLKIHKNDFLSRNLEEIVIFIVYYGRKYGSISELLFLLQQHESFGQIKKQVEKKFVKNNLVKIRYQLDVQDEIVEEVVLAFDYFATCQYNPDVKPNQIYKQNFFVSPDKQYKWLYSVSVVPVLKHQTLQLYPFKGPLIRHFQKDREFWNIALEGQVDELMKEFSEGFDDIIFDLVHIKTSSEVPQKWENWKKRNFSYNSHFT